jgi:hypothetical protein
MVTGYSAAGRGEAKKMHSLNQNAVQMGNQSRSSPLYSTYISLNTRKGKFTPWWIDVETGRTSVLDGLSNPQLN